MFCPKCRSIMKPDKGAFICRNPICGCEVTKTGEPVCFTTSGKEKEMTVIEGNAPTLPRTRTECPKCGHLEAFWVLRQTRAADEPETKIFRCVSCSHSWREY
ncbi:MAG TPA: transcription factor S [Methanomassiliicoccales archaeon]|nr:transcription factor S [Methanomassiliicoccales archaeon]